MSFSWMIKGDKGIDILEKYDINSRMTGLAPDQDGICVYSLSKLRSVVSNAEYAHKYFEIARDLFSLLKEMIRYNVNAYYSSQHHCETCCCEKENPIGINIKMVSRFLDIPLEEIHTISGGY